MKLEKRIALVTGGSDGIGRAIAVAFAREGADVAVTFLSSEEGARETCRQIEEAGRRALMRRLEVTQRAEVEAVVGAVESELGPIDVLVNNAGLTRNADLLELPEEIWDRVVDVNLKGTFLVTQPVARRMLARGTGVIVNMSSIAGMVGATSTAPSLHYNAAKQGIVAMTRTMARAFAPKLRVNALAPGVILTGFHEKAGGTREAVERRTRDVPLQRGGTAEEVARAALFLASDDSSYVTGQTLVVDGGLGMP